MHVLSFFFACNVEGITPDAAVAIQSSSHQVTVAGTPVVFTPHDSISRLDSLSQLALLSRIALDSSRSLLFFRSQCWDEPDFGLHFGEAPINEPIKALPMVCTRERHEG